MSALRQEADIQKKLIYVTGRRANAIADRHIAMLLGRGYLQKFPAIDSRYYKSIGREKHNINWFSRKLRRFDL